MLICTNERGELCKVLLAAGCDLPIVLISGATDDTTQDPMKTVEAIAALYKPTPERSGIGRSRAALCHPEQSNSQ